MKYILALLGYEFIRPKLIWLFHYLIKNASKK